MKKFVLASAAIIAMSASAQDVAMYTDGNTDQEKAAVAVFQKLFPNGVVSNNFADVKEAKAIWVEVDNADGNLPESISAADLKAYVQDGGNLFLSHFATKLVPEVVEGVPAPGIVGTASDCDGADDWTVNGFFGSMQLINDLGGGKFELKPTSEVDYSQVYDRTGHPIYAGLSIRESLDRNDYPHISFPLIGTDDPATILKRDDHNCMWDLNSYDGAYQNVEGTQNTLEAFEAAHNATVLGTWGHVRDYCVAGIVEFDLPQSNKVIANGLAAYQFSRDGQNAFTDNTEKLTANTLNYLVAPTSAVAGVEVEGNEAPVFYNLQGVRVAAPENGLYIKVVGNKASKVIVK